jgi:hypothetical protein
MPAANGRAAEIVSGVNAGCPVISSSTEVPAANSSKMSSTVMRVPSITGFPIITFGSETISGARMDDSFRGANRWRKLNVGGRSATTLEP